MVIKGTEYSKYNFLSKGGNVLQPTQSKHKQCSKLYPKNCKHVNDDDSDDIFG